MEKSIKKHLAGIPRVLGALIYLSSLFLINNCQGFPGKVPQEIKIDEKEENKVPSNNSSPNEIILFCGNPGVGKSSLCNSIFEETRFISGYSKDGSGITTKQQEYIHKGKLYIDTPGLADTHKRELAAKEIEASLKKNNNYKIIFVVTLESGRFRPDDFETVRCVCDSIKTPFEYGIVINKATKRTIGLATEIINSLNSFLKATNIKQPSKVVFISEVGDMRDEDNVLMEDSKNRSLLLNFISELKANNISADNVENIDVKNYEAQVRKMESKLAQILEELEKQRKENEKLKKQLEEEARFRRRMENASNLFEKQEVLYENYGPESIPNYNEVYINLHWSYENNRAPIIQAKSLGKHEWGQMVELACHTQRHNYNPQRLFRENPYLVYRILKERL